MLRAESIDEMRHAESRDQPSSCFSTAFRTCSAITSCTVGETVKEQLESDLQLEYSAITVPQPGDQGLARAGDHSSEELMTRILVSEETHTDWIETQLELIRQVGEQNYLAQQMKK